MTDVDFDKVLDDEPVFRPFFRLKKCPAWLKRDTDVVAGDELMLKPNGSFSVVRDGRTIVNASIGSSYIEFKEYRLVSGSLANAVLPKADVA